MSGMDDLIAFITARLDEDEAAAKGLAGATRMIGRKPDFYGAGGPAAEAFWDRFDPGRVLREVEARRAIIDRYKRAAARGQDDGYVQGTLDAVTDLAWTWNDHEDYRPEWAPEGA